MIGGPLENAATPCYFSPRSHEPETKLQPQRHPPRSLHRPPIHRSHDHFTAAIIAGLNPANDLENQTALLIAEDHYRLNRISRNIQRNLAQLKSMQADRKAERAQHKWLKPVSSPG